MKSKILVFVLLGVLLIVLGWMFNSVYSEIKSQATIQSSQNIEVSNISQCSNMSLENTSLCLIKYVRTFYNYTVRTDIPRTEEDIRMNGGDCYDYTELYIRYAKELGFYGYHVPIQVTEKKNHGFAVMSNKEGYCILDEIGNPKCEEFIQ
jgi:hypothetical protein